MSSKEHNCNLENFCLMTARELKHILVAYQENPSSILDICEKLIKKLEKMQKHEIMRRSAEDAKKVIGG